MWQPTDTTTFTAGLFALFRAAALRTDRARRQSRSLPTRPRHQPITENTTSKAERDHYFDVGASQIILPGLKVGDRRLLQDRQQPARRGTVRCADHSHPVQLPEGLVRGVELPLSYDIENWSFYGNFAASTGAWEKHQLGAIQLRSRTNWPISPTITSISITTRPTPTRPASNTRLPSSRTLFSADLIAGSGLRATNGRRSQREQPAELSAGQSQHRPADRHRDLQGARTALRHHQPVRPDLPDPQRLGGRGRQPAIRAAPHVPRRADAALLVVPRTRHIFPLQRCGSAP